MKKFYLSAIVLASSFFLKGQELVLVKDIRSGTGSSSPANFTSFNGKLFFAASDGSTGTELWQSDGTESGTSLVQDFNEGSSSFNPANFAEYSNALYFAAGSSSLGYGTELYRYSTDEGIVLFADIRTGTASSSPNLLTISSDNKLYFKATDPETSKARLYWTDGETAPEIVNSDYVIGSAMGSMGDAIIMAASTDGSNNQLYKYDGTGISLVKEIRSSGSGILSTDFIYIPGQQLTYFVGRTDEAGYEPWVTDGTTEGTRMLKDINQSGTTPGTTNSSSDYFTEYNGKVYFSSNDAVNGGELWVTDGTTEGTVLFADIKPGADGSNPAYLTVHNGLLYFIANDTEAGRELFVTDGTLENTKLVGDFNPGSSGMSVTEMISVGDYLYLNANLGTNGKELYRLEEEGTLGVGTTEKKSLTVYPNPSTGNFRINATGTVSYYIYDMSGRIQKTGITKNGEINTSLAPGQYIISVKDASGMQNSTIIIK